MKRFLTVITLALLSLAARAQTLPLVDLTDAAGSKVTTSSLVDGKTPFVISMWMTTCKPCLKELDATAEELLDWDGPAAPRIYAVSVDDSRSLQRAIAMSKGRDWEGLTPLFDTNGSLLRALNVSAVPQVFLYDKNGKLIYTHIGYRPGDELELLKKLKAAY